MTDIQIIRNPQETELREKGVETWPIWEKSISTFPWTYADTETCYFLEGEVVIRPINADPVRVGKGDLVVFPAGLTCSWEILKPVRKHFSFEIDKSNSARTVMA